MPVPVVVEPHVIEDYVLETIAGSFSRRRLVAAPPRLRLREAPTRIRLHAASPRLRLFEAPPR